MCVSDRCVLHQQDPRKGMWKESAFLGKIFLFSLMISMETPITDDLMVTKQEGKKRSGNVAF